MVRARRGVVVLGLVCASVRLWADDWPHWRGPYYNGVGDATGLPAAWGEGSNVRWRTELPGGGAATPAVWGDRIYLSATDAATRDLLALCVDRASGKILWRRETGVDAPGMQHGNTLASPSPMADGTRAIFLYGHFALFAFTPDGELEWSRDLAEEYGKPAILFGYSASPLLYGDRLYVPLLQRDRPIGAAAPEGAPHPSLLLALDPETGRTLWEHRRDSAARDESLEAYTTPLPFVYRGRAEIVINGGDCVTGHDPGSGRELWRWDGYNPARVNHWRIVPSLGLGPDMLYLSAPKREPVYALHAGAAGAVGDEQIAWRQTEHSADVCTPLYYRDRVYVLDGDRQVLSCLDARTGERKWVGDLGGKTVYRASPTAADGKIFCVNEAGVVTVVAASDEFVVLGRVDMGEGVVRASPVLAGSEIFIRTSRSLYCIAEAGR